MTDLKYVTYCGLYCRLCATLARIPQQSSALRETLQKEGWEYFGQYCVHGFKEFWAALEKLSQSDKTCKGCRGGCGDPDCGIRKCARERQVEVMLLLWGVPLPKDSGLGEAIPEPDIRRDPTEGGRTRQMDRGARTKVSRGILLCRHSVSLMMQRRTTACTQCRCPRRA